MKRRVRAVTLLFAVIVVVVGAFALSRGPKAQVAIPSPRTPVYPDLVSAPLADFLIGTEETTAVEQLRFTSTIANIGAGTLRIQGTRDGTGDWAVTQWLDEPDGQPSGRMTGATLTFGGHGHEHWHLRFGASYRLRAVEGGEVGSQTKAGFCFFDQVRLNPELEGAPADRRFLTESCGTPSSTEVEMGMSVGWSDPYFWQLEDQSVDITGLPDGRYRLTAQADPDDWIAESDESNNATWADLQIGTLEGGLRSVEVVAASED
ncbi:MAG: lysyl oxidase family protein [Candidatus Limnocylindrales bacterium]